MLLTAPDAPAVTATPPASPPAPAMLTPPALARISVLSVAFRVTAPPPPLVTSLPPVITASVRFFTVLTEPEPAPVITTPPALPPAPAPAAAIVNAQIVDVDAAVRSTLPAEVTFEPLICAS